MGARIGNMIFSSGIMGKAPGASSFPEDAATQAKYLDAANFACVTSTGIASSTESTGRSFSRSISNSASENRWHSAKRVLSVCRNRGRSHGSAEFQSFRYPASR